MRRSLAAVPGRTRRFIYLPLLALAGLAFATAGPPAAAQSRDALARHFKAYLASLPYSSFLAEKVLAYDAAMPPRCRNRKLTGDRRLFSITELPAFVKTRKVPVAGQWAERVQVERCGRKVWHNVYLRATKKRGLHAVVGFPGHSLTGVNLQLRAGRAFLKQARKVAPKCKRYDVIATRVSRRPKKRGDAWSEVWTAWVCGRTVTRPIRFTPRGKGVAIDVQ
jgi:hypothetical protein